MVNEKRPSLKSEAVYDALGNVVMRTTVRYGNGKVLEKDLTLDQYLAMLGNSTYARKTEPLVTVGDVPDGYYWGMVGTEGCDTFRVVVTVPAQKRMMSYGGKHWNIPFPALAFRFDVQKGIKQVARCYALAEDKPSSESRVFNYPFGNVGAHGSICYGNIHSFPVQSMKDVAFYIDAFFNSVTNNDLYAVKKNNATAYTQDELLMKLKKLDCFPIDWLKASSSCKNLAELCR